jgi:hypothetical protein
MCASSLRSGSLAERGTPGCRGRLPECLSLPRRQRGLGPRVQRFVLWVQVDESRDSVAVLPGVERGDPGTDGVGNQHIGGRERCCCEDVAQLIGELREAAHLRRWRALAEAGAVVDKHGGTFSNLR